MTAAMPQNTYCDILLPNLPCRAYALLPGGQIKVISFNGNKRAESNVLIAITVKVVLRPVII